MAVFLNFKGDYNGLSSDKAEEHLSLYGENVFHETEDKRFRAYHSLLNPWSLILIISGIAELVLGDTSAGLACFAIALAIIIALAVFCMRCNESAEKCTSAARMKYRVVRDDKMVLLPSAMLVPDDIIIVQSGEMVPADAHILEESGLLADESRFTGSKAPIKKHAGSDSTSPKLKTSCIYAGTRIIGGSAIARVVATGEDTYRVQCEDKRIKKLSDPDYSGYEMVFAKLKPFMLISAAAVSLLGLVFAYFAGGGEGTVAAFAVRLTGWLLCLIPPFVELFIRAYMISGAKRISRKSAAVKNLGVIHRLSGLTTIVLDKDAVVSPGALEVAGVYSKNTSLMTTVTVLAGSPDNPTLTEQAFLLNAALGGTDIKDIKSNELIRHYEYSDADRVGGNIYKIGDKRLLCIKGAAEKVAALCSIDADALYEIQQRSTSLCSRGLEVWASAYTILEDEEEEPKSLYSIKYTYMGMVSFMSATRDMIPLAVQACKRVGLKTVMVSSDNPETAAAMGKKIGLSSDNMINGEMMRREALGGEALDYTSAEIFSHVDAEQKSEIIDKLKASGEIVAVYGRGDSDYDMINRCDIGITSLENTTGCIYESSGLIVAQDNFGGIVDIIKEARQLHRNIKKCLSLCISALVAVYIVVLADILFSMNAVTAVSMALFTAVILPLCAMSFIGNTADGRADKSSSGFIGKGVINKRFIALSLVYGTVQGIICAVCAAVCSGFMPQEQTSSAIFIVLTICTCINAVMTAGKQVSLKSRSAIRLLAAALLAVILTYIPFVNSLFGYGFISPVALVASLLCGIAAGVSVKPVKLFIG